MEVDGSSHDVGNSHSLQDTDSAEQHQWSVECESLWHRIQDAQTELEKLPPKAVSVSVSRVSGDGDSASTSQPQSEDQVYRQLQEYEKRLRAELAFLEGSSVDGFPSSNKEVQYLVLQQDQRKQKQHLKETLSHVKAKHSSLVNSIGLEEDMNSMLTKLQDALKTKNAAISQQEPGDESSGDVSSDTATAHLRAKVNKVKDANKHFQNELKNLLSSFPLPLAPSTNEKRRKTPKNALDNTRDFDEENFLSLTSIIGKLMEQTLNSPEQPYIDISDRMWPQHIEFLLRAQIVLKDPDNSARMKLVPFHL